MKTKQLNARVRTERGTRACRRLRAAGEIPANLFVAKKGEQGTTLENVALAISAYDMYQLIDQHASLLEVNFDGRKELVQVTEVQRDAFGDDVQHVDLHMIAADKPIHSEVEFVFKGDAKGVKAGGKLLREMKSIELEALPHLIPAEVMVRIDDLDINDSIHIEDLELPEGVTATGDARQLVVHVVPAAEEAEEEALPGSEAPSEPEVISKGKQDEE